MSLSIDAAVAASCRRRGWE